MMSNTQHMLRQNAEFSFLYINCKVFIWLFIPYKNVNKVEYETYQSFGSIPSLHMIQFNTVLFLFSHSDHQI